MRSYGNASDKEGPSAGRSKRLISKPLTKSSWVRAGQPANSRRPIFAPDGRQGLLRRSKLPLYARGFGIGIDFGTEKLAILGFDDLVAHGVTHQFAYRMDFEFAHDIRAMSFGCLDADP
jgi:hypothetical protein